MKEDFLQYLWRHYVRLHVKYKTEEGESFVVLDKGVVNIDAGADIIQARIRIGNTEWAGSVEFHIKASDWDKHGHHEDATYNNVLLHFVAEADRCVCTQQGRCIPTFVFPQLEQYYRIFQRIFYRKEFIYCEKLLPEVSVFAQKAWLQRLAIERLEEKTNKVLLLLSYNNGDWEEVIFQMLARYLGQRLNGDAFEQLARKLPLRSLAKHRDSVFQLEALLFGQAGMLQDCIEDVYYKKLQTEYSFLQKKYSLSSMSGNEWKYLRLRPSNFPTLRIAQLAMLVHNSQSIFSQILEKSLLEDYRNMFSHYSSVYWSTHYLFGKQTAHRNQRGIGVGLQDVLIINVIVPVLFSYAHYIGDQFYQERALSLLQKVKPEKNNITKGFIKLGLQLEVAYDSQAVIQLKQKYCDFKRCERCAIGHEILKCNYK